jgi:predicted AlkP superfamily phosphohydrolase/phosphomutase
MVRKNRSAPVLMIGLDAAESSLVEQWMNDGSLPNLKWLRDRGAYGRLASTADWLSSSPWPTFYTGTWPAEHGFYNYVQWRPDLLKHLRPSAEWLPLQPFWRWLSDNGHRVVSVDVPVTFPPTPFNGIEISGWGTHDKLWPPSSHPPGILNWANSKFGPAPMGPEIAGLQSPKALLRLRNQLVRGTYKVADLSEALMSREQWDLFMVVFGATHRGGHKLWDYTGAKGHVKPNDSAELSKALCDVYVACDAAVGKLVRAAGKGVTILVFALHGMGANTSRAGLLPTMLDRIMSHEAKSDGKAKQGRSILQRARELVPLEFRHEIKHRLPRWLQDQLTMFWRRDQTKNLAARPAFCLLCDLEGHIRINLRGREALGIVEPGVGYEELCSEIAAGLFTFIDPDSGSLVVKCVRRGDQLYPEVTNRRDLPDLIVRWNTTPAVNHQAVVSSHYGSIPWPTPGRIPDGRSGHHVPEGFLIATGSHIQPASQIENAHILDLVPTVYSLLDAPRPAKICGEVISAICNK